MPDKVADASAIAALVFEEPEAAQVEAVLRGHTLFAPALLPFEMASVCLKKMRLHPEDHDAIHARFDGFKNIPVTLLPVDPHAIVDAARMFKLSAYDAGYLLLAKSMNAELVTLDRDLAEAWAEA